MSLDLNFYVKDFREVNEYGYGNSTIKSHSILDGIKDIMNIHDEDINGEYIIVPNDKVIEIATYLGTKNDDGFYNGIIGEIITFSAKGEQVAFNASW